jgi:hypothetical protein
MLNKTMHGVNSFNITFGMNVITKMKHLLKPVYRLQVCYCVLTSPELSNPCVSSCPSIVPIAP